MDQNPQSTQQQNQQSIVQSIHAVHANIRRVNKQFHSRVPTLDELEGKSSGRAVQNSAPIKITTLERT